MNFCDLHTHSVYSDGTWTPTQLIRQAEKLGLQAIALTDHNTVAGLPEFLAAAGNSSVKAIAGVEFSTEWEGIELHILGLYLQPRHFDAVTGLMEDFLGRKERSNRALVDALNQAGYALDYETIKASTPNGQVNRAHIGAAMVKRGYIESIAEAFSTLLSSKNGYYVPPQRLGAFEAIDFIKSLGATAVLAHPLLDLEEGQLRTFLDTAAGHGLDGMEVLHPSHDAQMRQLAAAIAAEYHLKPSGGSDFHGSNKPDISLGCGRGDLAVPADFSLCLVP